MTTVPRQKEIYWQWRAKGLSQLAASQKAGFSIGTAKRLEGKVRTDNSYDRAKERDARKPVAPIPFEELKPEATRALTDFAYFQRRYFGRISTPWQADAAGKVLKLLESPEKEMAVINAPPGSGKTTLFTHDIPAWLTVRNRAIRGLIGSKTESGAGRYTARLRRSLERTTPMRAEAQQLALGLALDAEACLCDDYGVFRTGQQLETWSGSTFIVAQMGGLPIDEKEPTWMPAGYDSAVLGMRYDFVVWDDLVDKRSMRTEEARSAMHEWWDDVAEARLEPSGLLLLQGQRMGPEDLYHYALNKLATSDDDEDEEAEETIDYEQWDELTTNASLAQGDQVYYHIVYPAHDESKCDHSRARHRKSAPYWPDGCLLDPRRLGWTELRKKMYNRQGFAVVYQQLDVDPGDVLVPEIWVSGGTDPKTGFEYPGCWDKERDIAELPANLAGDLVSYCTVDPSPTKYWAVEWWVARCINGVPYERYLLDLYRGKMDAPDFLEWRQDVSSFAGLAEDWQQRAEQLGHPVKAWIVERNGAQRFLLQYDHVKRWCAKWRTEIWPHDTGINKSDPELGVQTLGTIWKYGLVRLPGKGNSVYRGSYRNGGGHGFTASAKLVEEVTRWPGGRTDDCVMSQWFGELALPKLAPPAHNLPKLKRPSWMSGNTYTWAQSWMKRKSA